MTPITLGKDSEIAQRTRWYIRIGWVLLPAISLPSLITEAANGGMNSSERSNLIFLLVALFVNAVFYGLIHIKGTLFYFRALAICLLAFDILLVSTIIYARGGLESRSVILYIFPILVSAPIFGGRAVYVSATAAVILYNAQVILDYLGIIHPLNIHDHALHTNLTYVLVTIVYISSILILCAVIADYITRLLILKEQQASESLAALNKAQHLAKMGSWEWDKATGVITYSDGFYTLLHLKRDNKEHHGYGLLRYIHPDEKVKVKHIIDQAYKRGVPYRYDARLSLPNKRIMFVRSEGEPLINKAGEVVKVFGTVHDITDIKQLDLARSDFVAIASHQLRTPASSVKQYIGMLLGGYAGVLSAAQLKMLQTAYESNERQIIIVNDLLRVAQLDTGHLRMRTEVVDIVTLLHEIIEDLTPNYAASDQLIKFSTRIRQCYCKVDPSLIRMVIENLVDNARKYSEPDQIITVSLTFRNGQADICVTDHGVGIAHDDLHKLFKKFTRIENALSTSAGGSGLGLYLSQKLVSMHGGKIVVASTEGNGSKFSVMLPGTLKLVPQKKLVKSV